MNSITISNQETSPVSEVETQPKRGRGRPAKYRPEERKDKYKELSKNWQREHKDEYKDYQHNYYTSNSDTILKQSNEYHIRARNALRLLTEMLDEHIEIPSEKYKGLICDLVKNKKIIYT